MNFEQPKNKEKNYFALEVTSEKKDIFMVLVIRK